MTVPTRTEPAGARAVVRAGASARALLLTLLGEFVLPDGGAAWTSALIDGLATVGVEERTARQALARTATSGLLVSERRGRQSRWSLTPPAERLLQEGADRIYSFGERPEPWDGRWLLVLVTVPESNRPLRYRLRVRLGWFGLAPLASGVWISPHAEREADVLAAVDALGLGAEALSFVAAPGAIGDLEARVSSVWDLPALEARYEAFVDGVHRVAPADDRDAFAALLGLVHEWRQFPAADPGLPERLLPNPWSGAVAAGVFRDRHARWRGPARSWWQALAPGR